MSKIANCVAAGGILLGAITHANYDAEDFCDDTEKYWVQFKAKY